MSDLDIRDCITNKQTPARGTGDALHVDASPDMVAIVQSDTEDQDPILVGLRFNADGTVVFVSNSVVHTITVTAGEYMPGRVDRVNATTTDLADADMIGYTRIVRG